MALKIIYLIPYFTDEKLNLEEFSYISDRLWSSNQNSERRNQKRICLYKESTVIAVEPWLNYCPYNNLMSPENPFFFFSQCLWLTGGFPGGTGGKEPVCYAGGIWDLSSIPGLGRPPGGEHGNPLQYSCLENPTDRGGWWATVKRVAKSQTGLKRLSRQAHTWLTGSQFPGRSLNSFHSHGRESLES